MCHPCRVAGVMLWLSVATRSIIFIIMSETFSVTENVIVSFLQPDENSLDFSSCMLRPGIKNAQDLACGVCLLNVDSRSKVSVMASTVKLIFNL